MFQQINITDPFVEKRFFLTDIVMFVDNYILNKRRHVGKNFPAQCFSQTPTALFCFHSNSNLADSHFGIVQMVTQHASMKSRTFPVEVTAAPGLGCKRRSTVQLNPQTLQVRTTSLWTHRNWLLEQRSLSANTDNSCIKSGNQQLLSD